MPGVFCCMGILSLVYPLANISRYGDGVLPAASSYLIMSFETAYLPQVLLLSIPKKKSILDTALEGSSLIWRGG